MSRGDLTLYALYQVREALESHREMWEEEKDKNPDNEFYDGTACGFWLALDCLQTHIDTWEDAFPDDEGDKSEEME